MLRGIVFDFDGVIVDSHAVHVEAWRKFLATIGRTVSEEQLQFVLDGRRRDDILRHFLGNLDAVTIAKYGHQKERIFRNEASDVSVIAGLSKFLSDAEDAQLPLAIASSGSRSRVEFLLQQLGLKQRFRAIVTGDEVPRGKPDPALFLAAARKLQIAPADLIVFEDAVSGVKAAKAAGIKCIGIAEGQRAVLLLDAGADYVTPDFHNISHSKLHEVLVQ